MKHLVLVSVVALLLCSCAGAMVYKQNCVDIASSAGHTYQRMFKEPAMVATGYDGSTYHAQAYCIKNDRMVWITATYAFDYGYYSRGAVAILAVGVDSELDTINGYYTLEEFDKTYGGKKWLRKKTSGWQR